MSDTSPNLLLPYLAAGQAQKHISVNQGFQRLDALVQLVVVSATTSAQPPSPTDGQIYILPSGKTGAAWGAMTNESLAYYRDGVWEQITPRAGWIAYVADSSLLYGYSGSAWALLPAAALGVSSGECVLGRFSSGAGAVEEIAFTDQARQLCDDGSFQAMCATLGAWRILAASAVAASHTGATSEAILASVPVPAGAMGPNGALRISTLWSYTNSANAKTMRCRLGGASGSVVFSPIATSTSGLNLQRTLQNRNSQASQICFQQGTVNSFATGSTVAVAVDTASAQDLVFTGQLANSGETVTLESYLVELFYGA